MSKIINKALVSTLSIIFGLFLVPNIVSAEENMSFEENLKGVSNLEFKTKYNVDCPFGESTEYYDREILLYLQSNGLPVIPETPQQSYPRLTIYLDCISHDNSIVFTVELNVFKKLALSEASNTVIIYDTTIYGAAEPRLFNNEQKKSVVKSINAFIERWKVGKFIIE